MHSLLENAKYEDAGSDIDPKNPNLLIINNKKIVSSAQRLVNSNYSVLLQTNYNTVQEPFIGEIYESALEKNMIESASQRQMVK